MIEILTMSLWKCWLVQGMRCIYIIHDSYIAVSWLCRCKGVGISNNTFTMILCVLCDTRSTILSYVDRVRIALTLLT